MTFQLMHQNSNKARELDKPPLKIFNFNSVLLNCLYIKRGKILLCRTHLNSAPIQLAENPSVILFCCLLIIKLKIRYYTRNRVLK